MESNLLPHVPDAIRKQVGSESKVCILPGEMVYRGLQNENAILMACNPRIHFVIPGIMKAAQELDSVVIFELTKTEGGLDGGYTGLTPEEFVTTIIEYAEVGGFTKPFVIHGDHITVPSSSEIYINEAAELIAAQLKSGFTSIALDASANTIDKNINILARLAQPLCGTGVGLEIELGVAADICDDNGFTDPSAARTVLEGLHHQGVAPHLLAIANGYKRGNYMEDDSIEIQLERTMELYSTAKTFGLSGLVQHGMTGTPLHILTKMADYGIRKGNIGTLWQNIAHAGLPIDLMDEMRKWARENGKDIKYATTVFKDQIYAIPADNIEQIETMAYREAKEFITAFRAKGTASRLAETMRASH